MISRIHYIFAFLLCLTVLICLVPAAYADGLSDLQAAIADLIEIMVRYGAVNAMNLDGGSSSIMLYEGKQINAGAPLTGGRKVPTALIVK